MPVNSFGDYPMSWKPKKELLTAPKYRALADLLADDILTGKLPPHTKLPPQRELADYLDLNFSTVTRAFQHCTQKGLIYGITGRGTFVSPNAAIDIAIADEKEEASYIEMGIIKPLDAFNTETFTVMEQVLRRSGISLLDYSYPMGTPYQRAAAQKWLAHFSIDVSQSNIAITAGAQNALAILLLTLFRPGDKIATDHYTYANFIELANLMQIRLVPISDDKEGILPDVLENHCRLQQLNGIYLVPNYHNPTGHIMRQSRKEALAAIIRKYQLLAIEDDIYGFLLEKPSLPLAHFAPNHTFYICSLSKSICSGLRIAYLTFPTRFAADIRRGIYNVNVKTASLNSEIAEELIYSGTAQKIIQQKRIEAAARSEICKSYFPEIAAQTLGFSLWLPLPEMFYGTDFEHLAQKHGISVCHSHRFLVGDADAQQYLRIALSSHNSKEELSHGLSILRDLFTSDIHEKSFCI